MPVGEGSARRVLTGQTNGIALVQQRGVGQRLRHAPVERLLASEHAAAVFQHAHHAAVQLEPVGQLEHALSQALQRVRRYARVHLFPRLCCQVVFPLRLVSGRRAVQELAHHHLACFQRITVVFRHRVGFARGDNAVGFKPVRVDGARRLHFTNALVHQRLRHHRFVGLVMAVPPVTHQVNDDVVMESHAIIQRQLGNEQHGVRVVAVDVKNRCLDRLGDLGAIQRGARLLRMAGSKADLVIDHHVYCATGGIGRQLGKVERFGDYTLADERRIADEVGHAGRGPGARPARHEPPRPECRCAGAVFGPARATSDAVP